MRDKPNRFLVDRLNHSAKVSYDFRTIMDDTEIYELNIVYVQLSYVRYSPNVMSVCTT